ncbi:hypothetical protein [Kitasatospora sp. KL5]|uniref:hypothetical protein n=1 Tax=Kitasatospora sp. KL5 TaxID=3425125 RepID=UPI003D6E5B7B
MKSPSGPPEGPGDADRSGQDRGASETGAATPSPGPAASPGTDEPWIVLATVPSSGVAERAVVHLGRAFRLDARHGRAGAFVVTRDRDSGAFRLVQSRFVTASGVVAAAMGMSVSIMVGFHGLGSALKGARAGAGAVRAHEARVGAGAERVRELLDQAGGRGAGLVIRCPDDATAQKLEADAARRAIDHWRGTRSEFLAALERLGSEYDWLRPAVGGPAHHRR